MDIKTAMDNHSIYIDYGDKWIVCYLREISGFNKKIQGKIFNTNRRI